MSLHATRLPQLNVQYRYIIKRKTLNINRRYICCDACWAYGKTFENMYVSRTYVVQRYN